MSMYRQASHILAEELEGEVLAIDERTGTYYSMAGSATGVWNRLIDGVDPAALSKELAGSYPERVEVIEHDVRAFAQQLQEAELIEVVPAGESATPRPEPSGAEVAWTTSGWAAPQLGVHSEMQDILLFDPVHQVDYEKGWPHKAEPD